MNEKQIPSDLKDFELQINGIDKLQLDLSKIQQMIDKCNKQSDSSKLAHLF